MKKTLTTLLSGIMVLAMFSASAQNMDTVKTKGWFHHDAAGAMQIQVSYRKANLGQLNQVLNANSIGALGHNDIWYNLSMSRVHNQWIGENGLGFTLVTSSEGNGIKASYNQYQAYLREGYNLVKNPDYRLFPFVGVNFSAAVLNIKDKDRENVTSDFSDQLLNSTSSKTLYQPNFGIELGAGLDYVIKLKPKQMDCFSIERNIPVGIRAGYYINATQGDWQFDNYKQHNGPDKKQSAVFISLNIGLGYSVKK